ncbi:hypothetical protein PtrSN002B_008522 [Pyrenophora tritici-repentis]|uniref:Uncharacterized protein n=2 Tax=Pyrenophora tritici-repentis TaxID=45151 RepID=A0A2W1D5X1_9PLEO|nr:uncharacterized protein PTRG_01173 [Pyrenophora tritici-repentis Pt-1C-BFP]KAA8625804.1 hypothetical protein PtrV1_01484 [Pyrenophora tritici-repentis]EDU40611.1 predicted protein [Pyrenophora tritici-repentis Pt-1C-BFP]KAF7454221.1 hypothetical protein A1F99_014790 [Pyrenophora tritici-repentis]KAF7577316.1 hypothetical protein PtrM4_015560 [Pyrenophora tritici-repentis]KAG9387970.1 hypothetical protein A1F94_000862 [Pyrenophora tritici-repentis]
MSPLSKLPRVHARVISVPRYPPPRIYPNIRNSTSSHPPPPTTPTGIITHPLTPTPTPSVPSAYTPDYPTAPPHHMSLGTKLGLGMIPVVVGVCFMWIFCLLWWRRRQARKALLMGKLMPLTPEKDRKSFIPPVEDSKRGSRVLSLSAYSTQVSGGRYVGPRPPRRQEPKQKQWRGSNRVSTRMSQLSARSAKNRSGADSPIDSSSPFKLKRGSTVRKSLGSEISDLWPSPPPPTAWVKRRDILESLPSSRFGQDMSGQKPLRMSGQERRSAASSSKRPSRPATSGVI